MPNHKTKITHVDVRILKPYPNNSRKHSGKQIDQICKSIEEFGFTNPILIDEDNNVIAGHGRLLAALKLEKSTVPCIHLVGLTEEKKKAYVIADNKISENSEWDYDILREELDDIDEWDLDIDVLGFSPNEIEEIFEDEEEIVSDRVNTKKHSIEDYEASSIRQIILVYSERQYGLIIEAINTHCRENGLGSNTEAITHLLGEAGYEVQDS